MLVRQLDITGIIVRSIWQSLSLSQIVFVGTHDLHFGEGL